MDCNRQVFNNLDIDLSSEELEALFNEIDVDKSNTIDIDELIYFMTKNQETVNPLASSALMNIRLSKKLSLLDFRDVFKTMPSNFTLSFLRICNKKLKNLPSSSLKPKVDSSGLFYENLDIYFNGRAEDSRVKRSDPKFVFEVKFIGASGVPIPSEKNVKRESIFHRELKIALFDQSNSKFIGNVVNVSAKWSQNYEDRWSFQRDYLAGESSIVIKIQDFDESKMKNVALIIEFVIYFQKGNQLLEISCGYASLDIINMNSKSSKMKLNLEGGAPFKKIAIRKDDVQANRKGWRNVVKKITKDVSSQLEIEIIQISKSNRDMNDIRGLPPFILVNKFASNLFSWFREYLAKKACLGGMLDVNLGSDVKVKTFLKLVDCPDTFERMCKFWNDILMPKTPNAPIKITEYFSKMIDQFYLTLANSGFAFNSSDPTAMTVGAPLFKVRSEIVTTTLDEIQIILGMKQGNVKKIMENTVIEPIVLNDMGSDSEEENFLSQIKKRAKKHLMENGYGGRYPDQKQGKFGTGFSGNASRTNEHGFRNRPENLD